MELGELCCAPRCCQQSRWAAGCVQLEDHGLNLVLRSALEDRITGCWASPAASCPLDGCCSGHFSAPRRLHLASEQRCLLPVEVFPGCELSQPGPVAFLHLPPWILPLGAHLQPYPRGCASVQEQTFQQNNPAAPPAAPHGGPTPWRPLDASTVPGVPPRGGRSGSDPAGAFVRADFDLCPFLPPAVRFPPPSLLGFRLRCTEGTAEHGHSAGLLLGHGHVPPQPRCWEQPPCPAAGAGGGAASPMCGAAAALAGCCHWRCGQKWLQMTIWLRGAGWEQLTENPRKPSPMRKTSV